VNSRKSEDKEMYTGRTVDCRTANSRNKVFVAFGILRVVCRKTTSFWDETHYVLAGFHECIEGVHCVHHQGGRVSQARNKHAADGKQSCTWLHLLPGFLSVLFFDPEDGDSMFLRNVNDIEYCRACKRKS
jgi:hypothetical protein